MRELAWVAGVVEGGRSSARMVVPEAAVPPKGAPEGVYARPLVVSPQGLPAACAAVPDPGRQARIDSPLSAILANRHAPRASAAAPAHAARLHECEAPQLRRPAGHSSLPPIQDAAASVDRTV